MKTDLALLLIRLAFGFRLIYGTIDNIVSWERMLEFRDFLDANDFPLPLVSAIVSVYLQFIAGIMWIVGFKVREASIVMTLNFIVALIGVHLSGGDPYIVMAPAIHILVVSVFLMVNGGGRFTIDRYLKK